MRKIFDEIVDGVVAYMDNSGLKSMVLGISGGIDSTVCAAIGWKVKQKRPYLEFYGVSLPCSTNERSEIDAAFMVGTAFFQPTKFWETNLQSTFEVIAALCSEQVENTPLSNGNIKARLRNIYLRDLAGKTKGLVLDTDNVSENKLGFFTIAGDVGDLNPIGSLWKHEVQKLAKWIVIENFGIFNSAQKEAVEASLALTPTDGNGVAAGGDLAQIAPSLKNYEELDEILSVIVDYHEGNFEDPRAHYELAEDLKELKEKYGEETVNRIEKRYLESAFKRKKLPIKIKLSSC